MNTDEKKQMNFFYRCSSVPHRWLIFLFVISGCASATQSGHNTALDSVDLVKMTDDMAYLVPTTPIRAPLLSSVADDAAFHRANALVLRNPRVTPTAPTGGGPRRDTPTPSGPGAGPSLRGGPGGPSAARPHSAPPVLSRPSRPATTTPTGRPFSPANGPNIARPWQRSFPAFCGARQFKPSFHRTDTASRRSPRTRPSDRRGTLREVARGASARSR